jgi:hypothetical protein
MFVAAVFVFWLCLCVAFVVKNSEKELESMRERAREKLRWRNWNIQHSTLLVTTSESNIVGLPMDSEAIELMERMCEEELYQRQLTGLRNPKFVTVVVVIRS